MRARPVLPAQHGAQPWQALAGLGMYRPIALSSGTDGHRTMQSIASSFASLLQSVQRPGDFFAEGRTALMAPSLEVDGVGPVALPLLPVQARQLIAVAEPAPYGRGTETLVDPTVRRCWQISPDRMRIRGQHWMRTLDAILEHVTAGLGVTDPVTAAFYKLLVYDQGSFFVDHRDTEKAPGMFATLLVVLPSDFSGGELVVRHKDRVAQLDLRSDDPGEVAFAAFYADCVHEVRPITAGHRLVLVYNLVREGKNRLPEPPNYERELTRVAALLRGWRDRLADSDDVPEKLVYPLEHAYTPAELGFAALKGADRAVAGVLTAAAQQSGCDLHLALLTVEETCTAEYSDDYRPRYGRSDDEDEGVEAGEVLDQSTALSHWQRPDGATLTFGEIPVEPEEFSPPDIRDSLTPDEEHFHEATGNEGATIERTYRRAALVLWPGGRTFAVLSQAGLVASVPYLEDLAGRSTQGADEDKALSRGQARELAKHIIARWPQPTLGWRPRADKVASFETRVLTALAQLDDAAQIERFLTEITAAGSYWADDNAAVIAALDRLAPPDDARVMERIIAGTATTAWDACADLLAQAATAWPAARAAALSSAATRLLAALPRDQGRNTPDDPWTRLRAIKPDFVVALVTGLAAIGPSLAAKAVDHILTHSKRYDPDLVLVPAVRVLMKRGPAERQAAERLRAACIAHLRARTAEPLAPPSDWRRSNALPCNCHHCADLARFLAHPEQKVWVLKAAQADRSHVENTVRNAGSDVDIATDRKGRPYSLVCTKNQASYQQRAAQRTQDLQDLAAFGA